MAEEKKVRYGFFKKGGANKLAEPILCKVNEDGAKSDWGKNSYFKLKIPEGFGLDCYSPILSADKEIQCCSVKKATKDKEGEERALSEKRSLAWDKLMMNLDITKAYDDLSPIERKLVMRLPLTDEELGLVDEEPSEES